MRKEEEEEEDEQKVRNPCEDKDLVPLGQSSCSSAHKHHAN